MAASNCHIFEMCCRSREVEHAGARFICLDQGPLGGVSIPEQHQCTGQGGSGEGMDIMVSFSGKRPEGLGAVDAA